MRVVEKELIRFAVRLDPAHDPTLVELGAEPEGWGGWRTRTTMVAPDGARRTELSRVFRARERRLALGKMVTWLRARYGHVRPLPERRARRAAAS